LAVDFLMIDYRIFSKPAGSSNGRTAAFGAAYPGSNPGPAGLEKIV
jgi:hypothetical protein